MTAPLPLPDRARITLPARPPETVTLDMPEGAYAYLASDFHLTGLGRPGEVDRERRAVRWLERIGAEGAAYVLLLGDTWDFWFEYAQAAPRGTIRLLGALAALADAGTSLYLFEGNHDMWMGPYLEQELGARIIGKPTTFVIGGRPYMLGHGDGLGPGDRRYKLLRAAFRSPVCRAAFRWLHPDVGMRIARGWSGQSRRAHGLDDARYHGPNEALWQWARACQAVYPHEGYVFGHRHLPLWMDLEQPEPARAGAPFYLNLGDWFELGRYARIDNRGQLSFFDERGTLLTAQDVLPAILPKAPAMALAPQNVL